MKWGHVARISTSKAPRDVLNRCATVVVASEEALRPVTRLPEPHFRSGDNEVADDVSNAFANDDVARTDASGASVSMFLATKPLTLVLDGARVVVDTK